MGNKSVVYLYVTTKMKAIVLLAFCSLLTVTVAWQKPSGPRSDFTFASQRLSMQGTSINKFNSFVKRTGVVFAATVVVSGFVPNIAIENNNALLRPALVSADSTGKMSTKLTARKRYLPRILKVVPLLSSFQENKASAADMQAYFSSEDFNDLLRAMNLYGFSLRKGEAPDDISRKGEQLTESFGKKCSTYAKSGKLTDLDSCLVVFDEYKVFSRLDEQ